MVAIVVSLISLLFLQGSQNVRGFTISPTTTIAPSVGRFRWDSSRRLGAITNPKLDDVQQMESDLNSAEKKRSYLDDGFVFGLQGSGIERPKGKEPSLVVEGDELETKPYQVALVLSTFAFHTFLCVTSVQQMMFQNHGNIVLTAIQAMVVFLASWTLADFGSGVLHWSVDNYGNGRTPIMGGIIAAFQGHHSAPWTITYREFCNNVYKLCIPFGIPTMLFISLLAGSSHPMSKFKRNYISWILTQIHLNNIF